MSEPTWDDTVEVPAEPTWDNTILVAEPRETPRPMSLGRKAGDLAIGLGKGVLGFGDALVGLADIPTLGKAGKYAASTEWFNFAGAQDILDTMLSPEQQANNKAVQDAAGFVGKVGAMLENPSTIVQTVLESAPSMLGGAGIAMQLIKRGVPAVMAAAVGEGVVASGASVEGIRQRTKDGELTVGQTAAGVTSGVLTSLLSIAGGKFARRLGIEDVDILLAQGSSFGDKKNVIQRVLEGMIAEGALEELPQSMQEQMAQNWATGRPLTEGVADAAAQGLVTGAAMGGAANIRAQRRLEVRQWTAENPEVAARIAEMENPSRKDWEKANLPRMSAQDRAAFAAEVRAITADQADPAAPSSTTVEPVSTTVEEAKPAEPPTLDEVSAFASSIADLNLSDEDHASIMDSYARNPDQAEAAVAEYRKSLEDQPVPDAIVEDVPPAEESQPPAMTDEERAMQDQLDLEAEAAQAEGAKPLTEAGIGSSVDEIKALFPDYSDSMVEVLAKLPDDARGRALKKLKIIEDRIAASGGPAVGAAYLTELAKLRSKITAGATVLRAAQEKLDKGHKNADPKRLEYGKALIAEFFAIDENDPKYHPIDAKIDSEGGSGVDDGGQPYTARREDGNTVSFLVWSKKLTLNGKTLREPMPIHWRADVTDRYGHKVQGFGHTRKDAIDEAKSRVADSEKSTWEQTRKKWSRAELDAKKDGYALGTIAFSRGFKRSVTNKATLVDLILKDQELKEQTGRPYEDKAPWETEPKVPSPSSELNLGFDAETAARIAAAKAARTAVPPPVAPKKGPLTPEEKAKRKLAKKKFDSEKDAAKSFRTNVINAIGERGWIRHYTRQDSDRRGKRYLQDEISRISHVVRKNGKMTLDQMVGSLQEDNIIPQDWTANDLWELLVWGRKRPNREDTLARNNAYYDDLEADGKALIDQHTKAGKLLQPGQRVYRNDAGDADDAVYEVISHMTPDEKDLGRGGLTYAIMNVGTGEELHVPDHVLQKEGEDARVAETGDGSAKGKPVDDEAPVGRGSNPTEESGTRAEAQGAGGKADLELTGQTAAEIKAEEAKKEKAAKRKAMLDRAAAPISGGHLDTTGDLLDQSKADLPLFAPPAPKPNLGVGAAAASGEGEFSRKAKKADVEVDNYTGLRQTIAEMERAQLGMPEEIQDMARTFPDVLASAWARLQGSETAGQELIDDLQVAPRPLTDVEVAMLLITKVRRFKARNEAASASAANPTDKAAKAKLQAAEDKLTEIFDVAARGRGKSITETARGLNALKMLLDDQFSLISMEESVRAKQGGVPLTEQQHAYIRAMHEKYQAAQRELKAQKDALEAKIQETEKTIAEEQARAKFAEAIAERERRNSEGTTRRQKVREKGRSLIDDGLAQLRALGGRASANPFLDPERFMALAKIGAGYTMEGSVRIADWLVKMRDTVREYFGHESTDEELKTLRERSFEVRDQIESGIDNEPGEPQKDGGKKGGEKGGKKPRTPRIDPDDTPEMKLAKEIKSLYRAEVEAGVTDLEEATRNVHAIIGDAEGLTPEQVRDAFSDYGKVQHPDQDEASKTLSAMRSEAQKLAAIEDVIAKLAPKKTGMQRNKPVQVVRELTKKLHRLMKEAGITQRDTKEHMTLPITAIKTRLKNQIEDLNKALATKTKMESNKGGVEYDAEAKALVERRDQLREQYDEMFPDEKLTPSDRLEAAKWAVKARMDKIREQIKAKERTPKPEGPVRADQELTRLREEEAMLKGLLDKYLPEKADPYADAKKASAIEERLTREIQDIQRQIDAGVPDAKSKGKPIENDAIRKLKAEKEARNAILDALRPPRTLTDDQRIEIAVKAAERSLADWEKRVIAARSGKFDPDVPKALPADARLAAVRAKRDAAKAEFDALKKLAFPGMTPEQRAVHNKRMRLERAIKEFERRIKAKDFTPKAATDIDISGSPEALKAQAELSKVKAEFEQLKEDARRASRTWPEIAGETAMDTAHTSKNYLSSVDISAPGRQGWLLGLAHPIVWFKSIVPMVKSLSTEQSLQIQARFRERPYYKDGTYQRVGLAISPDDGTGNFSAVEDSHRLDLASKVPFLGPIGGKFVAASNRAYGTFLNTIRAEVFDMLVANNPSDLSDVRLKAIAAGVNELSGRGNIGKHAETLAIPFWAPRFMKAAFDVATLKPIHGKSFFGGVETTKETRLMFAAQYGRMLASLGAIYALATAFKGGGDDDDDKIEWDIRSNKFGAIKFGNQYFNPIGFMRSNLTLLAQLYAGQRKTSQGKIVNLRDDYLPMATDKEEKAGQTRGETTGGAVLSWLEGKRHPALSALWSMPAISGQKYGGRKQTWLGVLKDLYAPLSLQQAVENYQIDDPDAATMGNILNMLGYDVKPDYKNPRVMRHQMEPAEYAKRVGTFAYAATGPKASPEDRDTARAHMIDMPRAVRVQLLVEAYKARRSAKHKNDPVRVQFENGKLTPFGERLMRLDALMAP